MSHPKRLENQYKVPSTVGNSSNSHQVTLREIMQDTLSEYKNEVHLSQVYFSLTKNWQLQASTLFR